MPLPAIDMPFNSSADSLQSLGEKALIQLIQTWLGPVNPAYPEGIGDDCAVTRTLPSGAGKYAIKTTDALTLGRHFLESHHPARAGAKLINRNLSDIAAMGGVPHEALLTILAGNDLSIPWLEQFFKGAANAADSFNLKIVGGDLSAIGKGQFSAVLALWGSTNQPILRTGARPGDEIWVTGQLGGSILGHHLSFTPRILEGRWLVENAPLISMIDLTDGLAKDLPALLNEGTVAVLEPGAIPISVAAASLAQTSGLPPIAHALQDGEDYELLFCTRIPERHSGDPWPLKWSKAFPKVPLSKIGTIATRRHNRGQTIVDASTGNPFTHQQGYEHF